MNLNLFLWASFLVGAVQGSSARLLYTSIDKSTCHANVIGDVANQILTTNGKFNATVQSHCWARDTSCVYYVDETSLLLDGLMPKSVLVSLSQDADDRNVIEWDVECCHGEDNDAKDNNNDDEDISLMMDVVNTLDENFSNGIWTVHTTNNMGTKRDDASVEEMILSADLVYKKRLVNLPSTSSFGNKVEVWEYQKSSSQSKPDRAMFVNGVLTMSTEFSTTVHSEAAVHPAMISHPRPQRVLLVDPYSPLPLIKEVLKYENASVHLAGFDPEIFEVTTSYFETYNDCSELINVNDVCTLDSRVFNLMEYYELEEDESGLSDMVESSKEGWGERRKEMNYYSNKERKFASESDGDIFRRMTVDAHHGFVEGTDENFASSDDQFDVIVVTAPSSSSSLPSSGENLTDWIFGDDFQAWLLSMSATETITIINSGHAPIENVIGFDGAREKFIVTASSHENGTVALIHPYDELEAKPLQSTFVMVLYDEYTEGMSRFFRSNNAHFDMDMIKRLSPRKGVMRSRPTLHYDGPVHQHYIRPLRAWESWFCWSSYGLRDLYPACKDFLTNFYDPSYHHENVEVRWDPVKGRSLFAAEDIPKGHFVGLSDAANSLFMDTAEWKSLNEFADKYPSATMYRGLVDFILAYGYESDNLSKTGWVTSTSSTNTFINHVCDGNENVGVAIDIYRDINQVEPGFLPPLQRRPEITGVLQRANQEMKAGDEFKMNYRSFRTDMANHPNFEDFLTNHVCDPMKEGFVELDNHTPDEILQTNISS